MASFLQEGHLVFPLQFLCNRGASGAGADDERGLFLTHFFVPLSFLNCAWQQLQPSVIRC